MKIPPVYFAYFALALFFGIILAFGAASMLHQPLPLQVPLSTQTLPSGDKTAVDIYAPAPAPVVVTTMPLPTITPNPTTQSPEGTNVCAVNSQWNSSGACLTTEMSNAFDAIQFVSLLVVIATISLIIAFLLRL